MSDIKISLILTAFPAFLIMLILVVTENFNVHPSIGQAPLISIFISILAIIIAIVAYKVVRDEEEIEEEHWKYKILEGLNLSYIIVSTLMMFLIVTLYFLKF